jgi:Cytochrome c
MKSKSEFNRITPTLLSSYLTQMNESLTRASDRTPSPWNLGVWIALVCATLWYGPDAAAAEPATPVGRQVYEQGWRLDAQPWQGQGIGGLRVDSTCASCHRRSGMGGPEGDRRVPAITAVDLFNGPDSRPRNGPGDLATRGARPGKAVVPSRREAREAYSDATLARAIRSGVDASGRPLGPLMPRYPDLDDATMAALITHLRTLQAAPAPGRVDGVLHLATIVTPDAPPARVRALSAGSRGAPVCSCTPGRSAARPSNGKRN